MSKVEPLENDQVMFYKDHNDEVSPRPIVQNAKSKKNDKLLTLTSPIQTQTQNSKDLKTMAHS